MNLLQIQQAANDLGAAATAEAVAQPTEFKLSILELATKGGWIMILLAVLSIRFCESFVQRQLHPYLPHD